MQMGELLENSLALTELYSAWWRRPSVAHSPHHEAEYARQPEPIPHNCIFLNAHWNVRQDNRAELDWRKVVASRTLVGFSQKRWQILFGWNPPGMTKIAILLRNGSGNPLGEPEVRADLLVLRELLGGFFRISLRYNRRLWGSLICVGISLFIPFLALNCR